MVPCCSTSICGTIAWLPICTAVAMPPPGPATTAEMVPEVKVVPLMNSPETSSLGTVVKAPMNSASDVMLNVVFSLVVACARMVPVLSRPPWVVSVPGVAPVQDVAEPLRQVIIHRRRTLDHHGLGADIGIDRLAGDTAVIDEGIAGRRAIHRIDRAWHRSEQGGTAHRGLERGHRLRRIDQQSGREDRAAAGGADVAIAGRSRRWRWCRCRSKGRH